MRESIDREIKEKMAQMKLSIESAKAAKMPLTKMAQAEAGVQHSVDLFELIIEKLGGV